MIRKLIASICCLVPIILFSAPASITNDKQVILLHSHDDKIEEMNTMWDDLVFADSDPMSNGMLDTLRVWLSAESIGRGRVD
ncbi:hypothetical protein NSQ54_01730 [Alkalihalobacillus sp. FSL W8-0930]